MNEVGKKSLNYESTRDKFDKSVIATKFLSKVLENAIRQSLFVNQRTSEEKCSISEKKAVHMINGSSPIVPIEATLDVSHMLCCLKNFEEQGLTYVVYEEPEDISVKTILVSETDFEEALLVVQKHEENQAIDKIYTAYGVEAAEAVSKLYQDKYDSINVRDNSIEQVLNDCRDRTGIDGYVCYIINRTNPENIAEIISIKKYKENNDFILVSEINIYKEEVKVQSYSEVDMEYGHQWQEISEHIIELMDAESGVVVFNTLQEVEKYKEMFYEQLELRNDLVQEIVVPQMSELGESDVYDDILTGLEEELSTKTCLFVEEKDNIREQIENYKYIQVLMREYEEGVIEYMTLNNSSDYALTKRMEEELTEELEERAEELQHHLQKAAILQIERICIVRNCIGKNTASLVEDIVDRNVSIVPERFEDIEYEDDGIEEDLWDGLQMKLKKVRRSNESIESEDMDESVS